MDNIYKPNLSTPEKWISTAAGTVLMVMAGRRRSGLLGLAGLGLLARGVSGFCPINHAIGRDTSSGDTRAALGGSGGVIVESAVTIERPVEEVYCYWRALENLPTFFSHLARVRDLGGNRSKWTAKGPLDTSLSWEAEIVKDVPPELISWRTLPNSDVVSAGSVRFARAAAASPAGKGSGTELRVKLQYKPPAGRIGAAVAGLFGDDAQRQIDQDLLRFKQQLETQAAQPVRPA